MPGKVKYKRIFMGNNRPAALEATRDGKLVGWILKSTGGGYIIDFFRSPRCEKEGMLREAKRVLEGR